LCDHEILEESMESVIGVGGHPDVSLEFRNALMANADGILPKARKRDEATSVFRLICKPTMGRRHLPPYAQLKGSWSSMKNGKPLFHHVLQCVSCWKKELPDGDCRQ